MAETTEPGVWIARYGDRSAAVAFDSEIEALRYAVDHSMDVEYVLFGRDVFTGEARGR